MADQILDAFYVSAAWHKCRRGYINSKCGLCERCLQTGRITAGTEVHHKIKLTHDNVNDPAVALNWDNLQLLCESCHHDIHSRRRPRRYQVDAEGRVLMNDLAGRG